MQNRIQLRKSGGNWTVINQPDSNLSFNLETTFKEDAKRVQSGELHASRMFTVESYGYKATDIEVAEVSKILQIVGYGKYFDMFYFSVFWNKWTVGKFYVGKGSLQVGSLEQGNTLIHDLSFNIIGVNPIPESSPTEYNECPVCGEPTSTPHVHH